MKKIIREYCEQMYTKKLDNLVEMDKFLETQNLPRLNHEEIKNLNRPITSKDIESVIRISQQRKALDLMVLLVNSTKLIATHLILFQKIEEKETPPYSLYEASITLIPKLGEDPTRKLDTNTSYEH